MAPKPPSYKTVEQFLQGKLTLAEATVLRSVNNATRALIMQAVVLSAPETFLKKPHEDLVLNQGLGMLIGDIFGDDLADNIMWASRRHDLHRRRGASGIQFLVSPELSILVTRYSRSKAIANALAAINRRSAERAAARAEQQALKATEQHKVDLTARYLIGTLSDAELVVLTKSLQGYLERTNGSRP
jgi:hypothetical protein